MRDLSCLATLLVLTAALGGCGGGGGGSSSNPAPGGPPAPIPTNAYSGAVIVASGTLSLEGPTNVVVDIVAGTIQFSTRTEGTVTTTEPNGSYRSADGLRLYTIVFDKPNLRLKFFRAADNTNIVIWSLTALTAAG